jgi:hypothetical protein
MKHAPSLVGGGSSAALLLGAALAAAGCANEASAGKRATQESVPAAVGPKVDTAAYSVEMRAVAPARGGAECMVEVAIVAKGEYHMNAQYPYKLKMSDPPEGVTYPKTVLERADGVFDEKKGAFTVPFVAARAGRSTLAATLSLSVCSAANCLMDRVPLELAVDVQ